MIVRLSTGQWRACLEIGTERQVDYLEAAVRASTNFMAFNMPASGVRALIAEFEKVTFTPKWGKRKANTPQRQVAALATLARHLNEWTCHPAFHGQAMPGVSTDVLAGWVTGYREWSPFPERAGEFMILVPEVKPWKLAGEVAKITTWRPGSVTHCQTEVLNEEEHLGWA